jgi:hypothetical protein
MSLFQPFGGWLEPLGPRSDCCRNEALPSGQTNNCLQIKLTDWTRDDRLRQAVFLGIREEKIANEVVREKQTESSYGHPVAYDGTDAFLSPFFVIRCPRFLLFAITRKINVEKII